ncbi:MAG: sulfite exporter TauE/SafE family protein [Bacillota bacterium]
MKKTWFSFRIVLLGILTGLINGLFGSGGGTILVPGLFFLLDVEQHKAHATAISVILPLAVISTFVYVKHGIVEWNITYKVAMGGMIGGYIGARLLNRIPGNILRKVFAVFMIIAAVRLVLP